MAVINLTFSENVLVAKAKQLTTIMPRLEETKLYDIDKNDEILPIIEKDEYKKGIPYVPFKAFFIAIDY